MTLLIRLFALIILTLLPSVGIEVYDEIEARSDRAAEAKDQALRLARLVARDQAAIVEGARQLLVALGKTPAVRDGDNASCNAFLGDLTRTYPQYASFANMDLAGHLTCAGGSAALGSFQGDRPQFKLAIQTAGLALGEYEVDDRSHQELLYLAQPYKDAAGNPAGVVTAGLSLDWLNAEVARTPLPPKATISVVDRQGTILVRYPGRDQFVGSKIPGQSHAYMLTGGEGVQEALGFDGIARIYSYTPVPGSPSGLTVSVGLDESQLLDGSRAANRRDILVIAGSFILALLLAGAGARAFITRPIRVLLQTADHWRQGDLGARVPSPDLRSEFGRLGAAFNAMAAAIGTREQELERRVQERTDDLKRAMEAQHKAEAALYEAQKVETVGRLTGGVAHDFNNILAAVVGNIELARTRLGPGSKELRWLDDAMKNAGRGSALVQQLLAFARRQNLRPAVVDLNQYVGDSQDMLQRLLRSDVTVETKLAPSVWLVRVDPNQLEAAVLNLAVNARDAMPSGGTLRLETRNVAMTAEDARVGLAGDFVALSVSDTGTGIPGEILEKVFEPFFTTKDVGAGSGLGLSMVQGFARQSSGSVRIDSEPGQGTTVTLYLPRTTDAMPAAAPAIEDADEGEGTVLLVDDDPEVRSVTAQLLEMTGYTVVPVASAAEALAYVDREDGGIDILVTDLVLANGLNGIDLAATIRGSRPELPVVLITGYSDALLKELQTDGMDVLTKPFHRVALSRAIRHAIRRSRERIMDHQNRSREEECPKP